MIRRYYSINVSEITLYSSSGTSPIPYTSNPGRLRNPTLTENIVTVCGLIIITNVAYIVGVGGIADAAIVTSVGYIP